jgi:hypothetical protein
MKRLFQMAGLGIVLGGGIYLSTFFGGAQMASAGGQGISASNPSAVNAAGVSNVRLAAPAGSFDGGVDIGDGVFPMCITPYSSSLGSIYFGIPCATFVANPLLFTFLGGQTFTQLNTPSQTGTMYFTFNDNVSAATVTQNVWQMVAPETVIPYLDAGSVSVGGNFAMTDGAIDGGPPTGNVVTVFGSVAAGVTTNIGHTYATTPYCGCLATGTVVTFGCKAASVSTIVASTGTGTETFVCSGI